MKKYILTLLTLIVILSSCKKEDDLLLPIPTPPSTTISSNTPLDTILIDTLTVDTGSVFVDTINVNTIGPDSCLISSPNFICLGKSYDIIFSKFSFQSYDTIYGYEHTNVGECIVNSDGTGVLETNVYPRNGYTNPTHSINMTSPLMPFDIKNVSYTPGIVTLTLSWTQCTGITIEWDVTMQVLEYIGGTIGLKIVNNGHSGPHPSWTEGPWSSYLYIQLKERL
tara:strand:+ start:6411 stop:7082 length:672 start_codon:yes stop_codon:yes gene_type:complete